MKRRQRALRVLPPVIFKEGEELEACCFAILDDETPEMYCNVF